MIVTAGAVEVGNGPSEADQPNRTEKLAGTNEITSNSVWMMPAEICTPKRSGFAILVLREGFRVGAEGREALNFLSVASRGGMATATRTVGCSETVLWLCSLIRAEPSLVVIVECPLDGPVPRSIRIDSPVLFARALRVALGALMTAVTLFDLILYQVVA